MKTVHFGVSVLFGLAMTSGCQLLPGAKQQPMVATDEQQRDEAQLSLARLSERHGQIEQAKRVYEMVIAHNPTNQLAHHRLAVIASQRGDFPTAEHHFQLAFEAAQPTSELLRDRGYQLYLQDRLEEAESLTRNAIAADAQNEGARNNLALILGESGRFNESLAEYRRVVSEAEANSNLGYIRTMSGDVQGAQQSYHRALDLDNKLKPAAEALVQLAAISTSGVDQPPPVSEGPNRLAMQQERRVVASIEDGAPRTPAPQVDSSLPFQVPSPVVPASFQQPADAPRTEQQAAPATSKRRSSAHQNLPGKSEPFEGGPAQAYPWQVPTWSADSSGKQPGVVTE